MADFNIKIKSEGVKGATGAKKQAVKQAQKTAQRGAGSQDKDAKSAITSTQKLTQSNKDLIYSNQKLISAMEKMGGMVGKKPPTKPDEETPKKKGSFLKSSMAGLAIGGIVGFAIQKINQIGSAYIETAGQQLKSAGVGGFRWGQGAYSAAEMGTGMKAYAGATGRFERGTSTKELKPAVDIGTIFGLSTEETFKQAGRFKAAGADYGKTAKMGLGYGIESQMPIFMEAISTTMQDAITAGVDASQLAEDSGRSLAALVSMTPTKSVTAALGVSGAYKGTREALARGKVPGVQGLYGLQATREISLENLQKKGGFEKLLKSGDITQEQYKSGKTLGKGFSFEDLQSKMGGMATNYLMKKTASEISDTQLAMKIMEIMQRQYGKGAKGLQAATNLSDLTGGIGRSKFALLFKGVAAGKDKEELETEMLAKGGVKKKEELKAVKGTPAYMAAVRNRMFENMLLKRGNAFAQASLKMEKSMFDIAEKFTGPRMNRVIKGMSDGFMKATDTVLSLVDSITKGIEKIDKATSDFKPGMNPYSLE